jgi:hypothetical protein
MFVEELERCQRLVYADELLSALESVLRLAVGRRRHAGQPGVVSAAVLAAAVDMESMGAGYEAWGVVEGLGGAMMYRR